MTLARTTSIRTLSTLAGVFCLAHAAQAGGPIPLSGSIAGEVKSVAGVAEMGAKVLLYDRHEQLIRQVLTNEQGRFGFAALTPDIYAIRVTLASFVPALRRNISVAAGSENLLQINLSGNFQHGGYSVDGGAWNADGRRLEVGAEGIAIDASDFTIPAGGFEQLANQQQRECVRVDVFRDRGNPESIGGG
jgi:hypothetical protein